jgi:hypothetical protein
MEEKDNIISQVRIPRVIHLATVLSINIKLIGHFELKEVVSVADHLPSASFIPVYKVSHVHLLKLAIVVLACLFEQNVLVLDGFTLCKSWFLIECFDDKQIITFTQCITVLCHLNNTNNVFIELAKLLSLLYFLDIPIA